MSKNQPRKPDPDDPRLDMKTPNGGRAWGRKRIDDHLRELMTATRGQIDHIAEAAGVLLVGYTYGYQVVRLCFTHRVLTRVQKHLDLDLRDVLPMRTQYARTVNGIRLADAAGDWWKSLGQVSLVAAREYDPAAG